jgi:hypothetical protein
MGLKNKRKSLDFRAPLKWLNPACRKNRRSGDAKLMKVKEQSVARPVLLCDFK